MFAAKLKTFGRLAVSASILLGAAACGDSTGTGDATLTLLLTDAPDPIYQNVWVTIGEIEILGSDGPPVLITSMGGDDIDLLKLQKGVTIALGSVDLKSGTYNQLRMVITEASIKLQDGLFFTDGTDSTNLIIPSGAQTGIKINLDAAAGNGSTSGIVINPGVTILVVDFDVTQNFKILGSPDAPGGIQGVLFTPLLRAVVENVAGSISGTVSVDGTGSVENASVHAILSSSDAGVIAELQTSEGTGIIAADGTYEINFLSPGTYDVTVAATDDTNASVTKEVVVVAATDVTANFTVDTVVP